MEDLTPEDYSNDFANMLAVVMSHFGAKEFKRKGELYQALADQMKAAGTKASVRRVRKAFDRATKISGYNFRVATFHRLAISHDD